MKAKTIIHLAGLQGENKVRIIQDVPQLIARLDRLPNGGTLNVDRVTDHGSVKTCYIPAGAITRFEEA